jgi:hypothetical protein
MINTNINIHNVTSISIYIKNAKLQSGIKLSLALIMRLKIWITMSIAVGLSGLIFLIKE